VSGFHDLVRTERYFSATLLPAILFHRIDEAQDGLKAFLRLTSKSVQDTGKSQVNWDPPSVLEADEIEVITEFHIARDLEHADLPLGETETSKRDAPDLVIVCEAKFFTKCSPSDINPQLKTQRQQFNHLFKNRPDLSNSHWHIAILPEKYDGDYDCDAVITWDEITELSADVLGSDHYVTRRFVNAMKNYRKEFDDPSIPGEKNYDGIENLIKVMQICRARGNSIQAGHVGAIHALESRGMPYILRKPWKWRDSENNLGAVISANWIGGGAFAQLVDGLQRP